MTYWHCWVDCITRHGTKKDAHVVVKREFVLEAADADTAWSAARSAAEDAHAKAFKGTKLIAADVRSVAITALPYEILDA